MLAKYYGNLVRHDKDGAPAIEVNQQLNNVKGAGVTLSFPASSFTIDVARKVTCLGGIPHLNGSASSQIPGRRPERQTSEGRKRKSDNSLDSKTVKLTPL